MNQCLPVNAKMSKAKKVLDEARETQNRELDLVDKGLVSFEELPGLCKYAFRQTHENSCDKLKFIVKTHAKLNDAIGSKLTELCSMTTASKNKSAKTNNENCQK